MNPNKKEMAKETVLRAISEKNLETRKSKAIDSKFRESHFELKGLLDNLADAYILMNKEGYIQKMNKSAEELFGFTLEDNVNVVSLIYKEDYMYAMNSVSELYTKGSFLNYKARVYTRKKGTRNVNISASVVYDKNNKLAGAQGVIRDITEDCKKEIEFNEQKNMLSIMVENSPLGIVLTKKGKILKVNKSFQNFIGYSNNELTTMTVDDVSFPEDVAKALKFSQKIDNNEIDNFNIIKRFKKKNGTLLIAKTYVNIIKDSQGKYLYQQEMIEDITNEVHESSMLKAINSLLVSIIGKSDINDISWEIAKQTNKLFGFEDCIIYIVNKEKGILEQIAAFGNKNPKEKEILDKIVIPINEGIVGSVAKKGKAEIINDTSKDPRYVTDYEFRYSEITVPIIINNEVIGVIDSEHSSKNFFTKTHLKTLISIANLAATQFKSAISARLQQEAEEDKKTALKELEGSNIILDNYTHIVSHELKSPIRNINTLTNWIKTDYKNQLDKNGRENLDLILANVSKMEALITGILAYSSLDKAKTKDYNINLNTLVNQIINSITKPNNIQLKITNTLPEIKANKKRIQQIFEILINNAIKYSKAEGGKITIGCKSVSDSYLFFIKDQGIGIDKAYHKKIFNIFNKLSNNIDSVGIGLSIVKKIISLYQGDIWVESEINKGSTFYFTLPKTQISF